MKLLFQIKILILTLSISFLFFGCGVATKTVSYRYYPENGNEKINNSKAMYKITMKPYTVHGKTYYPKQVNIGDTFEGIASWYGPNFHGKKTSNGEIYNQNSFTAAHKTFPMNTMVKVTRLDNGKITVVRVNDRGPFVEGRIIDLSYIAGKTIGLDKDGTTPVRLEVIGFNNTVSTLVEKPKSLKSPEISEHKKIKKDIKPIVSPIKPIKKSIIAPITPIKKSIIAPITPIMITPVVKNEIKENNITLEEDKKEKIIEKPIKKKVIKEKQVSSIVELDKRYTTGFAIQIGAFRKRTGALAYSKKFPLVNGKYKAIIKELVLDGVPIYKVWFVGFESKEEAKYFLQNSKFEGAFIVKNN